MKLNLYHVEVSILFLLVLVFPSSATQNYGDALYKSLLFFEGQRSGYLPKDQRVTWRGHSGLSDGWTQNLDLTGGYYDAGDNIKFNFPMAFTTTVLAWSVIEFGDRMPPSEKRNSLVAVRWGTDYLLKSVSQLPNRFFFQIGYPISDHNCWERPEDMDTDRTAYFVEAPNPASEVAGETAAALAAASIAFRSSDPAYADTLLKNAINSFQYADTYRGAFSDDPKVRAVACPFYCDFNGYQDELLWGAAWLWRATQDQHYLNYVLQNGVAFGAQASIYEFGWDDKHAGINVLLAKDVFEGKVPNLASYKNSADLFICTLIPESPGMHVGYTPGGLINKVGGANLQHSTALSLLLAVYADYMSHTGQSLNCGGVTMWPDSLHRQAKRQADYILGENPKGMSYMVGYGNYYPQRIHHRASALPSIKDHPEKIQCKEGTPYYESPNPNPNVLVGALVGGPVDNDEFEDHRFDANKSEPCTYINAPFVGVLAYLNATPDFS